MNAKSIYINLWLEYYVDFARLEQNAEQMVAYARELNEVDPDGFIRVWVHPFTGIFAHIDPSEDQDLLWVHQRMAIDINEKQNKRTPGEYFIGKHPDDNKYGIFYKELAKPE